MKRSIRIKLFALMGCLIVFTIGLSWFLNSQYLDDYYLKQKKDTMLNYARIVDKEYKSNPDGIDIILEKTENATGGNAFIIGNDVVKNISSRRIILIYGGGGDDGPGMGTPANPIHIRPSLGPGEFNYLATLSNLQKTGDYNFEIRQNNRIKISELHLAYRLYNGDILLIITPLAAISESASIANKFSLFVGVLAILIGSIFASLFSKRFTDPILKLNNIAQSMARLDFSKKYKVKSNDEIGELGASINYLSDQLDNAITQLNAANVQLQKDIEHERQLDKMRKEFISSVSHELKTPIALIQGYAEGLKDNIYGDEENREFYYDVIMDEAVKMGKLVKDLLDLSQIESGYFSLERSDFSISSLIDQTIEKYKPLLADKGIKLLVNNGNKIIVNADEVRIEQVLFNYLNNAIAHVDDQKVIKVDVVPVENGKVRVSVYNSGKAISEENIDYIWNSFYKADKARSRAYGGSGLGLSVVRAIQEQHHNKYGVINHDSGVEFWFEVDRKIET